MFAKASVFNEGQIPYASRANPPPPYTRTKLVLFFVFLSLP